MSAPRPPGLPRPPRSPSLQHKAPGAPPAPRSAEIGQEALRPYPADLGRYPGNSHLEKIVGWWLMARQGYRYGVDFLFQEAVGTDGAIGGATNTKGFLRVDFLLLPLGKHGGLGYPYQRGLILNPFPQMGSGPFQIHTIAKDRLERNVLATLGYRVVYLESTDLEERPDYVLRLALAGTDISSHRA
jgi:hypothetical protein